MNKATTEQVLNSFIAKRGDTYDYSKVVYTGDAVKVTIACREHGEFSQSPSNHKRGAGCFICGVKMSHDRQTHNTEQIINSFIAKHGDTYDYSRVEYKGNEKKVIIICNEHGEFRQTPSGHKQGKGCVSCGVKRMRDGMFFNNDQVISNFKKVHGDRYDYSNVVYKCDREKVAIICREHGEFMQAPRDHKQGHGCSICADKRTASSLSLNTNQITMDFKKSHGDRYDYSKVEYKGAFNKVIIICKVHGEFIQSPTNHKQGQGCPGCACFGFDSAKPGILYYLRVSPFNGVTYYKIGITNRTVEQRFTSRDLSIITVINTVEYVNGVDALSAETKILREFKEFKVEGADVLTSGNSELFTNDVLELDTK